MKKSIFMITTMMILVGMTSILMNYSYLMSILVSMEFLIISLFFFLMIIYVQESNWEILIFLVFSVIESVMGLLLMILKVYFTGSDFMSLNVY